MIRVACLIPTIPAHSQFLQRALDSIRAQVIPKGWNLSFHVDADPQPSLGRKLNRMIAECLEIGTEYVVLTDSDDLHHPTRVARQVQPLLNNFSLTMTGSSVLIYQKENGECLRYTGISNWIGGLAFPVTSWKQHKFMDFTDGVDTTWQRNFKSET